MITQHMSAAEWRRANDLPPVKAKNHVMAKARLPRNGRQYDRDKMNKTEERYAGRLDSMKAAGSIVDWKYEGVKFKLADRTYYTPDFIVITADGSVELHEVMGHWEDDARVKIKVAAEMYPLFIFKAVQLVKGEWRYEDFRKVGF